MFSISVLILTFLGLARGHALEGARNRRSASYHGPPAPLNHDGTVALTPEVHHARVAHEAAFAEEFKRLQEAESLAAAHPDLTSPHDHGWNAGYEVYASGYRGHGMTLATGHQTQGPAYSSGHYSQGLSYKHSPESHIPAPLNPDGTVAQTAAYRAIASSLDAEYAKAIHRLKHQDPHFQNRAAHSYAY